MKFSDIEANPTCTVCNTPRVERWTAICDENQNVKRILCNPCNKREMLTDWDKYHRLYSSLTMEASFQVDADLRRGSIGDPRWHEINDSYEQLQAMVKKSFEPNVWFGHNGEPFNLVDDPRGFGKTAGLGRGLAMMPIVKESTYSHLTLGLIVEGDFRYVVNTWCTAGRALIEIESDTDRITLITEDGSLLYRMGIQGTDCTVQAGKDLLHRAEIAWRSGFFSLKKGSTKLPPK